MNRKGRDRMYRDLKERHAAALLKPDPLFPGKTMTDVTRGLHDLFDCIEHYRAGDGDRWRIAAMNCCDILRKDARDLARRIRSMNTVTRKAFNDGVRAGD